MQNNKKRSFYCAYESIFDPVFHSQVLTYIKKMNERMSPDKKILMLVVFQSLHDFFRKDNRRKRREIVEFLGQDCIFSFKLPYFYSSAFLFRLSMVFNVFITFFTFIFFLKLKRDQKYIFQCRSEIGCSIVLSLRKRFYKRIKIICDSRGLGSKELLYKIKGHSRLKTPLLLERIENTARKNSDWIFCVSRFFRDYISTNNKIDPGKIEVIPCCVDTEIFKYVTKQRNIIRDELGIGRRFTVLYSGSLNEWQLPKQMISIFKNIREKIDDSIFLIITTSPGQAEELLYWSGLDRDSYKVISVPFTMISKYLMAGDIGLLIRENNEVNEVAFPIKLFEYIRCGVPVLTSITSDARKIISDYDAGFLIDDHNDIKETRNVIKSIFKKVKVIRSDEYKAGISKKIKSIADWKSYSGQVMEIYDKLMF